MLIRIAIIISMLAAAAFSQMPPIEPGVSHELAKWRAARYSDVRYKLNLKLEKSSPMLKGTIEIRISVSSPHVSKGNSAVAQPTAGTDETAMSGSEPGAIATGFSIVLDWRMIRGSEGLSTISNVSVNGFEVKNPVAIRDAVLHVRTACVSGWHEPGQHHCVRPD